jgi:hypothetical protein
VLEHGDLRVIPRGCKRNLGGSSWALGYGAQYFGCQEELRRPCFLAESPVPGGISHDCAGSQACRFLRAKVLLMGFRTQKTACLGSSAIVRYALHKSMLAYIRKYSFFQKNKKYIYALHMQFFLAILCARLRRHKMHQKISEAQPFDFFLEKKQEQN